MISAFFPSIFFVDSTPLYSLFGPAARLLQWYELSLSCRPLPRNWMETIQDDERYAGEHKGRSRRFDKQLFPQSAQCKVLALSEKG